MGSIVRLNRILVVDAIQARWIVHAYRIVEEDGARSNLVIGRLFASLFSLLQE